MALGSYPFYVRDPLLEQTLSDSFEELAKHYASPDGAVDLDRLNRQLGDWFQQACQHNGAPMAALWCGLQVFHEEIRRRVQSLINRYPEELGRSEHPLLKILGERLIANVRGRLEQLPDGSRFLNSPLDWTRVVRNEVLTQDQKESMWRRYRATVDSYFEKFVEDVIPVLKLEARADPSALEEGVDGRREPGDWGHAGHPDREPAPGVNRLEL